MSELPPVVDVASLEGKAVLTHVNLNDNTVEGMRHDSLPVFSVQYHPEASPGPNDATYLVDPTLHREFQSLHLRATHDATWIVDGKPAAYEWPLRTGQHTIIATNARGDRDRVYITVR